MINLKIVTMNGIETLIVSKDKSVRESRTGHDPGRAERGREGHHRHLRED